MSLPGSSWRVHGAEGAGAEEAGLLSHAHMWLARGPHCRPAGDLRPSGASGWPAWATRAPQPLARRPPGRSPCTLPSRVPGIGTIGLFSEDRETPGVNIFKRIEQKKLLSSVEKMGLLS